MYTGVQYIDVNVESNKVLAYYITIDIQYKYSKDFNRNTQ